MHSLPRRIGSWLTNPGRAMTIAAQMSIGGGMDSAGVLKRLNSVASVQ